MNLGSTEAVKQAIQSGLGISIVLAESVKQEVADGSTHAVPIDLGGIPLQKELFVICRQQLSPESLAIKFVSMLLHNDIFSMSPDS
jgi:DNA-binding transcriptional LysR family regulator